MGLVARRVQEASAPKGDRLVTVFGKTKADLADWELDFKESAREVKQHLPFDDVPEEKIDEANASTEQEPEVQEVSPDTEKTSSIALLATMTLLSAAGCVQMSRRQGHREECR